MMQKSRLAILIILTSMSVFTSSYAQKSTECSSKCQKKKEQMNHDEEVKELGTTNSFNPSDQLVCKLIGAELAEQKELLKKEIFSRVVGIDETDNGYILKFEDKNNILLKLTDYLMIEKECCPFFVFDLNIQSNSNGIYLKISGQEGAKEMLKPLVDEIQNKN